MASRKERRRDVWAQVAFYTSLGFILPAGAVAGFMAGWFLDRWLGMSPVLAVIFGFAGAGVGLIEVLTLLKRAEKLGDRNNSSDGPRES